MIENKTLDIKQRRQIRYIRTLTKVYRIVVHWSDTAKFIDIYYTNKHTKNQDKISNNGPAIQLSHSEEKEEK